MADNEQVTISFTSWERRFGDLPPALLKNRFFEQSPAVGSQAAMLARPGTDELGTHGSGPIRATYSQPGLFGGALFAVSGETLYRIETDLTAVAITGVIFGSGSVSMTGVKGAGYERLFLADGSHLQVYQGGVSATGLLTGTGHVADEDTIEIGGTYYQWVDTVASGAGTLADPWKVLRGADLAADIVNMVDALNFTGTSGTTYSSNLGGQNGDVTAEVTSVTEMTVTARTDLTDGNLITTTATGTAVSWGAATLSGGGTHGLSGVEVPDGLPPVSVATLKSYIIVALGDTDRFYFIEPGELTIDALNFATAESQPDDTLDVLVVGDTIMFVGESSTEVWYPTGNSDAPFAPVSGRVYDRGAIEGTVVNVKGTVFLVGPDNVVYAIGGSAGRVSNHGIEEMIRESLGA